MFFRSALTGGLAGGAVLAGLVWAGRAFVMRVRGSVAPPEDAADTEGVDRGWEADALDDVARMDALHDMNQDAVSDFDFDTRPDQEELAASERGRSVQALEQARLPDEPYDALDADDLGMEWLLRATQASGTGHPARSELLDGMHEADGPDGDAEDPREYAYGSDQEGAPLAPHAGTHDEDLAAELPVGTVDAQGNIELHAPVDPPDAFGAPPTSELAVTEEDLARRRRHA